MPKSTWIKFDPTAGDLDGSSVIEVEGFTGRVQRQGQIIGTTSQGESDTHLITQSGKPEFISVNNPSAQVVAKGDTVVLQGKSNSATLKLATGTKVIAGVIFSLDVNEVFDQSWNGIDDIGIDGDPGAVSEYDFKLSIVIPENRTLTARVLEFTLNNSNASVISDKITITQVAGVKSYAVPVISKVEYAEDIPASGGTVTPTVTYTQTWGWNENTTNGGTLNSGGTLAFTGTGVNTTNGSVTAPSLGTVAKVRSLKATASCIVTMNGRTSTAKTGQVYQEANTASYGDVSITGGSVTDIPASGGTKDTVAGYTVSQTVSFTSGATRVGDIDVSYSTPITASSLGTTVKSRTKIGTLVLTATGEGSSTATKSYDVYQQANRVTVYGNVSHQLSSPISLQNVAVTYNIRVNAAASQQITYTSGATRQHSFADADFNCVITTPVSGFSIPDDTRPIVSVTANPSASPRNGFVVAVTIEGEGNKTSVVNLTFNQQGSESTINITPNESVFEAVGGQKEISITSNDSWTLTLSE